MPALGRPGDAAGSESLRNWRRTRGHAAGGTREAQLQPRSYGPRAGETRAPSWSPGRRSRIQTRALIGMPGSHAHGALLGTSRTMPAPRDHSRPRLHRPPPICTRTRTHAHVHSREQPSCPRPTAPLSAQQKGRVTRCLSEPSCLLTQGPEKSNRSKGHIPTLLSRTDSIWIQCYPQQRTPPATSKVFGGTWGPLQTPLQSLLLPPQPLLIKSGFFLEYLLPKLIKSLSILLSTPGSLNSHITKISFRLCKHSLPIPTMSSRQPCLSTASTSERASFPKEKALHVSDDRRPTLPLVHKPLVSLKLLNVSAPCSFPC